jgi:lipoprotein-releasing system permease protein
LRTCFFLLRHYLFPRGGHLLSYALWISVVSVAVGIAQLILVLAVMSGFLDLLEKKYTEITSQIVVLPRGSTVHNPAFRKELEVTEGVAAVTPFGLGQGMAIKNGVAGINLEGTDFESSKKVTDWEKVWTVPPLLEIQAKNPQWIWLGSQVAEKLKVKQGETIDVLLPEEGKNTVIPFVITGLMKFGIYDHDLHHSVIDLQTFNQHFNRHRLEPMYKVRLKSGARIETVHQDLTKKVGKKAVVKKWNEMHQNLFQAVRHQKGMLFQVLEIVIALAALNVINLLIMSSHQRKRDIAILRAMGFKFAHVVFFFLVQGAVIGGVGIILGIALGKVLCIVVEKFQPAILSEAIYNVTKLPLKSQNSDVAWIAVLSLVICVVFSALPAWRAARQRPVEALRYE